MTKSDQTSSPSIGGDNWGTFIDGEWVTRESFERALDQLVAEGSVTKTRDPKTGEWTYQYPRRDANAPK